MNRSVSIYPGGEVDYYKLPAYTSLIHSFRLVVGLMRKLLNL